MQDYCPPSRLSYLSLPVLQFLWGQPWDDVAQNLVHSLRPSVVCVTGGESKTNSVPWRVTVYVKEGRILSIDQECEVGLAGGFRHGHDLFTEASRRGVVLR